MAISVQVPKDLSGIKTKVALNLTKRQIICFSGAAVAGIPLYFLTKGLIGTSAASLPVSYTHLDVYKRQKSYRGRYASPALATTSYPFVDLPSGDTLRYKLFPADKFHKICYLFDSR